MASRHLLVSLVHDLNNMVSPLGVVAQLVHMARTGEGDDQSGLLLSAERDIEALMERFDWFTRRIRSAALLADNALLVEMTPIHIGSYVQAQIPRLFRRAAEIGRPVQIQVQDTQTWAVSDIAYFVLVLEYLVRTLHQLATQAGAAAVRVSVERCPTGVEVEITGPGVVFSAEEQETIRHAWQQGVQYDFDQGTVGWGWACSLARAVHTDLTFELDGPDTAISLILPFQFGDVLIPVGKLLPEALAACP